MSCSSFRRRASSTSLLSSSVALFLFGLCIFLNLVMGQGVGPLFSHPTSGLSHQQQSLSSSSSLRDLRSSLPVTSMATSSSSTPTLVALGAGGNRQHQRLNSLGEPKRMRESMILPWAARSLFKAFSNDFTPEGIRKDEEERERERSGVILGVPPYISSVHPAFFKWLENIQCKLSKNKLVQIMSGQCRVFGRWVEGHIGTGQLVVKGKGWIDQWIQ